MVLLWVAVVLDVIKAFTLPGELSLKHIMAQNTLLFHTLFAYIYTLWCCYSIPKGDEVCQSAISAFLKKWEKLFEGAENKEAPNEDTKETAIVSPEDFERFKKGEMTKEEMLSIKKAVDKVTEMKQEA